MKNISSYLTLRTGYLLTVGLIGLCFVSIGLFRIPTLEFPLIFGLMVALAVAAQLTSTALTDGSVIVEVSTAVSLASVFLFDPFAAGVVAASALTSLTLLNLRNNWSGWRPALERIGFNLGMASIAMVVAGFVFVWTTALLGENSFLGQTVPWLLAAIVNDQVNLWLLIGILHIQSGIKPVDIWNENKWAIPINVMVMSVGGGILAIAVVQFSFLGIAIFFLPIAMSAYSFRLYVEKTKKQMDFLEDEVARRTKDLEGANKELEDLHQDKNAFLAVLTHDMRTPLASVKGYASILRDREMPREQQVHIAKVLLRSGDTLLGIVNNILELEKLASGTPILLERSKFDLRELLLNTAESIESLAMEKSITLRYEALEDSLIVNLDKKKIERVLTNLISNAVKYTESGGDVTIRGQANGRFAIIDIQDTGYGIPADELPHIFDRFRRVSGHRHIAVGTGLGLAVVKNLVETHEGEIHAQSEVNVGSTFTLKLPLSTFQSEAAANTHEEKDTLEIG